MYSRIREWWKDNKTRIGMLVAIILVGILCFEAGLLQGKIHQMSPLVLTLPPLAGETAPEQESVDSATRERVDQIEPIGAKSKDTTKCLFVGSKNSNKYHLSSCSVAKRIKPENKVCFASKEEAERRGYVPSCLK